MVSKTNTRALKPRYSRSSRYNSVATRPTKTQRIKKLLRKYKKPMAATGLGLAALATGLGYRRYIQKKRSSAQKKGTTYTSPHSRAKTGIVDFYKKLFKIKSKK
jgi:hypothetical protein